MRVHHVAIQVASLARAKAFYVDVLELPVAREQPHSVWVDADGTLVMLELGPDAARGGLQALAFSMGASSRDEWRAKLAAAGVAIESESDFTIYVRDPDGTRVALSSYPVKSR